MVIFGIEDCFGDFTDAIATVDCDGIGSGIGWSRAWTVSGRSSCAGIEAVSVIGDAFRVIDAPKRYQNIYDDAM